MKDGGTAFPALDSRNDPYGRSDKYLESVSYGMTLRDYFAGQALAGMMACFGTGEQTVEDYFAVPKEAYAIADEMLAEREKSK